MFPLGQRKINGYRFAQKTWYSSRHLGTDYFAVKGAALFSPFDGEIVKRFWGVQGGNTIWFKPNGQNVIIRFMHLSDMNKSLRYFKSGQVIGHTGNTGSLTSGAHLHLDISKGAVNIWNFANFLDPEKFNWKENPIEAPVVKPPEVVNKIVKGIDISHWQGNIDWTKVRQDFVIMKCSGGDGKNGLYRDVKFDEYKKGARSRGMGIGYYHFAGGLDPTKEADYFLESVGDIAPGELLALDFEIKHPDPVGWCNTFVKRVKDVAGFWPLFYSYSSMTGGHDWKEVYNCGLWIADPSAKPRIGKWPFWAIWQYTIAPKGSVSGITERVDMNYFNGSMETFKRYGKRA